MKAAAILLLAAGLAAAQKLPWENGDAQAPQKQFVRYLYPEQVEIAANKDSVVELHFEVNTGFHINSHTPHEKSFIPTQLIVAEPAGLKVASVDFPPGTDFALASFPNEKLSVYTGEFIVRAHVKADPGDHLIQAQLRYQACDAMACFPPRKAPVAVDVIAK
ncbi:MAG TPA: protein-disulfide reductase DsbD domain-containing protein [Silvibacterium sp.]|nr:protein-disulfide reductase DsbD domain-containing protein [Silvibacterium sp.]